MPRRHTRTAHVRIHPFLTSALYDGEYVTEHSRLKLLMICICTSKHKHENIAKHSFYVFRQQENLPHFSYMLNYL